MKTTEILKIINDYMILNDSWKEQYNAIYENIEKQRKALLQQLNDLNKTDAFDVFKAQNAEKLKLSDEAFEKIMAFIKSIDDDKVNKFVSQFERGIITAHELVHQFRWLTHEVSFDAESKSFLETNW